VDFKSLKYYKKYAVDWYAPFYSGGGYSSEAFSFLQALNMVNISIKPIHHGDTPNQAYLSGLSAIDEDLLFSHAKLEKRRKRRKSKVIAVCHSEPGAWSTPHPKYQTTPCPPANAHYKIGGVN
jgi:hypothetical protein